MVSCRLADTVSQRTMGNELFSTSGLDYFYLKIHLGVRVLDYNSFWRNQFSMSLWESMLDDSEFYLF